MAGKTKKKTRRRKSDSKMGKWVKMGIAALGVAFAAGAVKAFINFDTRKNAGWKNGAVTFGAALATSMALKAFGLGKNGLSAQVLLAGAGVAAYQAFSGEVNDWGVKLANGIRSKTGGSKTAYDDGVPTDGDGDGIMDFAPPMASPAAAFAGGPVTTGPSGLPAGMSAAPQPVYNINVEAAKVAKANPWVELGKAGIGEIGNVLGAFNLGGSGASPRQRMALGSVA